VATTKIAIFHGGPMDRTQSVVERFPPTYEFATFAPVWLAASEYQQVAYPRRAIYRTYFRPIPMNKVCEYEARGEIPDQEVALYVFAGTR